MDYILTSLHPKKGNHMEATLKNGRMHEYIDLTEGGSRITREGDLNDLLSLCYYHESNFILMDAQNLSDEFFNLKSGLAGAAMQKFANYRVKVALILPGDANHGQRFKELMFEMSGSNHFRFYDNRKDAESWLAG